MYSCWFRKICHVEDCQIVCLIAYIEYNEWILTYFQFMEIEDGDNWHLFLIQGNRWLRKIRNITKGLVRSTTILAHSWGFCLPFRFLIVFFFNVLGFSKLNVASLLYLHHFYFIFCYGSPLPICHAMLDFMCKLTNHDMILLTLCNRYDRMLYCKL